MSTLRLEQLKISYSKIQNAKLVLEDAADEAVASDSENAELEDLDL